MIATDLCVLPTTGNDVTLAVFAIFALVAGILATRWMRSSMHRVTFDINRIKDIYLFPTRQQAFITCIDKKTETYPCHLEWDLRGQVTINMGPTLVFIRGFRFSCA